MTSWEAQGKLIGMAKEKGLLPWDRVIGAESDTIRFDGCTFFFFDSYVAIWCVAVDGLEMVWYDNAVEADFVRWVDVIEAMKGAQ